MSEYEIRLESYLQSLRETRITNEEHDYDILFPSKNINKKRNSTSITTTDKEQGIMSSLFKSVDVENEVINQYFQQDRKSNNRKEPKTLPRKRKSNFDDEEEDDDENEIIIIQQEGETGSLMEGSQLDMTSDFEFVVATQVDIQNKVKQKKENEQVLKWSNYLEELDPITSNLSKLNEFFSLPDNIFEAVCSTINMGSISIEFLSKMLTIACSDKNISEKNLETLAHYGLLPKVCESNIPLRTVFPLYQKLLNASNPTVMIHGILLPMFQKNSIIPKPFWKPLNPIDKHTYFILAITWMDENYMELSTQFTLNLINLLEGMTDVDDQKQDTIVKILERSLRYSPKDENISHFFLLVVNKFGQVISKSNLKELQKLGYSNESSYKKTIQDAIKKYLTSCS